MKTKEFNGIKFNVYTDKKIEGDFIKPNEAVYFENDIEITGRLEVKYLKTGKCIYVHKSYIVDEWEEVGGSQKVGRSQEVGWSQKVGWYQKVGEYQEVGRSQEVGGYQEVGWYQEVGRSQEVGGSQKVGWSQKVGEYQEVGGSQKVGEYQEVGGNLKAKSSRISLYSKVKGKYDVKGKVFIGVCEWRDTTEEEETLECGKFISGDIKYGKLKEIGLPEEEKERDESDMVEIKIDGKTKKISRISAKELNLID